MMKKGGCSVVVILMVIVVSVFVLELMGQSSNGYKKELSVSVNGKSGGGCSIDGCPLGGPKVNNEDTNLEPTFRTDQIGSADGNGSVSGFGTHAMVGAPF
tara:strand:+ start:235 stop:534 length:300 start_codon:yes stop_codon:yes gene_type:complete